MTEFFLKDRNSFLHKVKNEIEHAIRLYGKKYKGVFRTTFVINEKGVIEEVITDVDTSAHAEQILKK